MKKIINILTIASLILSVSSCKEDEYEVPSEYSSLAWYTSLGTLTDSPTRSISEKGNYVSFADFSSGAVEHYWYIKKGDYFLKGNLPQNNGGALSAEVKERLQNFIQNPGDTVITDKSIAVMTNNLPFTEVRLYNVYNDSIAFESTNPNVGTVTPIKDEETGKWIIDKTFRINVYDTIVPGIKVYKDGVELVPDASNVIDIEAGDLLTIEDASNLENSRPTDRRFALRKSSDASAVIEETDAAGSPPEFILPKSYDFTFVELGDFTTEIDLQRGQFDPGSSGVVLGQHNPPIFFGPTIRVGKSTKPLDPISVGENVAGNIAVKFPGGFVAEDLDLAALASAFSVTINGTTATVEAVSIATNDPSVLEIQLTESVYDGDIALVSYDASSPVVSRSFENPTVAFTDLNAPPFKQEFFINSDGSFAEGGFEAAIDTDWESTGHATLSRVTVASPIDPLNVTDVSPTGNVIRMELNYARAEGGGSRNQVGMQSTQPIELVEGANYKLKFKYYFASNANYPAGNLANLLFLRFDNDGGSQLRHNLNPFDANNLDRWIQVEIDFVGQAKHKGQFMIRTSWRAWADISIDDLSITTSDPRP
ncbi:hypothetical protein [Wenyingzhuangia sp. IMCC45574]